MWSKVSIILVLKLRGTKLKMLIARPVNVGLRYADVVSLFASLCMLQSKKRKHPSTCVQEVNVILFFCIYILNKFGHTRFIFKCKKTFVNITSINWGLNSVGHRSQKVMDIFYSFLDTKFFKWLETNPSSQIFKFHCSFLVTWIFPKFALFPPLFIVSHALKKNLMTNVRKNELGSVSNHLKNVVSKN